jgi:hypothetical protein
MTCAKSAGVHLGDEIRARGGLDLLFPPKSCSLAQSLLKFAPIRTAPQVEPKEHAPKMEKKEIDVPSNRESHESASRVKIAYGKGADSAPMR